MTQTKPYPASGTHREIAPPSHRLWAEQREDEYAKLEQCFSSWIAAISHNEAIFKKHVYDNPNMNDVDLRQHRQYLYVALANGEELAVEFIAYEGGADVANYVKLIDQKLGELRKTLHEWHAPIDFQDDIPESFKQSVREVAQGKIFDLDVG